MRWTLDTVAAAVGGIAVGSAAITSVTIDSRSVGAGALFVALRGDRVDGHEFIASAMTAGAVAALVGPGRLPDGVAGVEVADPVAALAALAARRRGELKVPVIAVTGSTGKTTTKDLIAGVAGPGVHAAPNSYNNEIGVPLTILSCPDDATALVVEVGSRGPGHIASLGDAIRPTVAVITNIGPAHLEMFGDLATVRRAKWELVEALVPGGTAVLPQEDAKLHESFRGLSITFGEDPAADVAALDVVLDGRGRASFVLRHDGETVKVALTVSGRHQPVNAAAAVAAAIATGVGFAVAAGRLNSTTLSPWRMEVVERRIADGTVLIVNDAYNANPVSMESALVTVAAMSGRHIAVLGMMHELGAASPALHEEVGRRAAALGFTVIVVGQDPGIARGAGAAVAAAVSDVEEAVAAVGARLRPGDVVLIKASRATGLERLSGLIGGAAA